MRGVNRLDEAKLQRRLWTPSLLPASKLLLWFDASDLSTITLNGSSQCTALKDKSGNSRNGASAGGGPPPWVINPATGLGVLTFATAERLDFSSLTTAAGWMVVIVQKFVTRDLAAHYILGGAGQGIGVGATSIPNFFSFDGTNVRAASGSGALGVFLLQTWMPAKQFLAGVETGYANTDTVGALTLSSLGDRPDTSLPYKGAFAEGVVLNSALDDDRRRLEGYMAWKYGLSLAGSNHPYLNWPPLIGA